VISYLKLLYQSKKYRFCSTLKTNSLGFKGYTYEINNGDKVVKIFFQKGHVDIIKKKN